MKPTKKKIMDDMFHYHDIIDFIEKKYNINVRDYANRHSNKGKESHFQKYQRLTGDRMPFNGHYPDSPGNKYRVYRDGKMVQVSKDIYDDDIKQIHDHYKRYQQWTRTNPEPSYLDYWHWLLDHCFSEVSNGSAQYWNIEEIIEDEDTPVWVIEITKLVQKEFKENLDTDGGLKVWISW